MTISNDPELSGKYLGTISQDFVKVADILKESSYQIRKRNYSPFPIFPISKGELPVGQLLLAKEAMDTTWNYYVTYLDEFIQRKLIDPTKIESFKSSYKDPEEFCCLFVADKEFTNYLYIPYPID